MAQRLIPSVDGWLGASLLGRADLLSGTYGFPHSEPRKTGRSADDARLRQLCASSGCRRSSGTCRSSRAVRTFPRIPREAVPIRALPISFAADHAYRQGGALRRGRDSSASRPVSLLRRSMVALYFVGLAVWQAVYIGQIDDGTEPADDLHPARARRCSR